MRPNNFHWVKFKGRWEPAEWIADPKEEGPAWILLGGSRLFSDAEFDEIDETPLTRPDRGQGKGV